MLSADYIRKLLPVATPFTSREIAEHIPRSLRDASVFSARNVYAGHVADAQQDIASALEGKMSAAEVRGMMKLRLRRLGYAPASAEAGSLTDLSSDARASLVVNMQMQRASSYARWRSDQDPAILDAFPGQELYRAGAPKVPRDWQARWNAARASLGASTSALEAVSANGPFFALKNDPVWVAISRFGSPFPPFDFASSMRVRNVGRRRCRELGLLKDEALARDLLRPARDPMDGNVSSSSAAGMDPALVNAWAESFGGRARVYTGRDGLPRVAVAPDQSVALAQVTEAARAGAKAEADFGLAPDALTKPGALKTPVGPDTSLRITADQARHIIAEHGSEPRAGQSPVSYADIAAIPETLKRGRWRDSTEQEKAGYPGAAATFIGDDGTVIAFRIGQGKKSRHMTVQTLYKVKKENPPQA
jgi:hypothetical protein